ncbi:retrovirus-related pol polyprotein from transposon tnt 1-94 [Senna tora]|uniref:Retrovirus-related pol polyprotein from transposon tnt 1-94 n=1 Tax=Senna tora TaxID=362788 RepID=A0A834XB08_9FABA|nr:retrovirus-related pol polyprotein from transposon tnt 1-94 [Senna tora]
MKTNDSEGSLDPPNIPAAEVSAEISSTPMEESPGQNKANIEDAQMSDQRKDANENPKEPRKFEVGEENFGPWMIAERRARKPLRKTFQQQQRQENQSTTGQGKSRFEVLSNLEDPANPSVLFTLLHFQNVPQIGEKEQGGEVQIKDKMKPRKANTPVVMNKRATGSAKSTNTLKKVVKTHMEKANTHTVVMYNLASIRINPTAVNVNSPSKTGNKGTKPNSKTSMEGTKPKQRKPPDFDATLEKMRTMEKSLRESASSFTLKVTDWNKKIFGNVFKKKREILKKLGDIELRLSHCVRGNLQREKRELWQEYDKILTQEELIWFQKARSNWLKFGDRNTRFFHTSTIARRQHNKILELTNEAGVNVFDEDDLTDLVQDFFTNLYTKDPSISLPRHLNTGVSNIVNRYQEPTERRSSVWDHQGNGMSGFAKNLGKGSAFQAEMWGNILGLHLAWDNGIRDITVQTDSKQVLSFINGFCDNSCQHYPMYREVIQLLARDWHVILSYVPRENNSVADKLANFGHSLLLVTKEGVVRINVADDISTKCVKLQDVYHVPGFEVLDNVKEISVDVIFSGEKKGSLFFMSAGEAYVKKTSQIDNASIWHARLGHVRYQLLQQISSKGLVDGMPTLKNVREDAQAVQCACHVTNRLPPWAGAKKSSFEALYGEKPNVNYFRIFGSICYVHVPKGNRTKLDPKARKCVFVGYDSYRKGWRCMDPKTKKFTTSRDVVFDEVSTPFSSPKLVALDDNDDLEFLFPKANVQDDCYTFEIHDLRQLGKVAHRISQIQLRPYDILLDYRSKSYSSSSIRSRGICVLRRRISVLGLLSR